MHPQFVSLSSSEKKNIYLSSHPIETSRKVILILVEKNLKIFNINSKGRDANYIYLNCNI